MYNPTPNDLSVQRAVDAVQRAIENDNKHNYEEAIRFYNEALYLFDQARVEIGKTDPVTAQTITVKMDEYRNRMTALREAVARNPFASPQPGQGQAQVQQPVPPPSQPYAPQFVPVAIPAAQLHYPTPPPPYGSPYQPQMQPPSGMPLPYSQPALSPSPSPVPAAVPVPVPATPPPITRTVEKGFVGHKNRVTFTCTMPYSQTQLRPNTRITMHVVLDNPTSVVISSLKLALIQHVHVLEGDKDKHVEDKVAGDEFFQGGRFPMKEEKYTGDIDMVLPPSLQPSGSINYNSSRSYDLVVKAVVSGIHKDVEVVFPVAVSVS